MGVFSFFWKIAAAAARKTITKKKSRKRPPLLLESLEDRTLPTTGTWTGLANLAPAGLGGTANLILLSNGDVMAASPSNQDWAELVPDRAGYYADGTWTSLPQAPFSTFAFASNVLPSGSVFIVGGTGSNDIEIFNPVLDAWSTSVVSTPDSAGGSMPTAMLPNGNVLVGGGTLPGGAIGGQTYTFDVAANTFSIAAPKLLGDDSQGETWVTLPDGSILTYDLSVTSSADVGHAQRDYPNTNTWVDAGLVPVQLSSFGNGAGPAFLLPDGRVFVMGGNGSTAFYTPDTNSWTEGPTVPGGGGTGIAPGVVLPNGHVLFEALGPASAATDQPSSIFDFDPTTNAYTTVTPPTSILNFGYGGTSGAPRMLLLPSGQVLMTTGYQFLAVYTPDGAAPNPAWQPTITSITANGNGSFQLTGTLLNGISEGGSQGLLQAENSTNYPLVRLVDAAGNVAYAQTFDWSSTGVQTGVIPESTDFTLPPGFDTTGATISVVANGIASNPQPFAPSGPYFDVTASPTATAGTPFVVTVIAMDQSNNPFTGYQGTVHFTSSDAQAVLPANTTLANGWWGAFSVTLKTAGSQTITASDTMSYDDGITGTSAPIAVAASTTTFRLVVSAGRHQCSSND